MTKVSLVVPIYNEEKYLVKFLHKIDELDLSPVDKELVFIDDRSSDNSRKILTSFKFKSEVLMRFQDKNKGKGAALRLGFDIATGDIIGVQDADFEYDINEVPSLIKPIVNNQADVVYGSRFKKNVYQVHRTYHYFINRFLTVLSNIVSGVYLTDMETCYKFFRSEILKDMNLESNRFGFEPEVTAKIATKHFRIFELPISYYPRSYLQGKKITWKDGIAALRHIFYFNLVADKSKFFKSSSQDRG